MFEVTKYEHPEIFVTCRRTGETYKFSVDAIGTTDHEAAGAIHDARQAALSYLRGFRQHGKEWLLKLRMSITDQIREDQRRRQPLPTRARLLMA